MDSDFYSILGVAQTATPTEIRERFRFLSHAYHPDKFATPAQRQTAETEFKRISEAYGVLSDPASRAEYDEALNARQQPPPRRATEPEYFLWVDGEEHGPFALSELREAVLDGRLNRRQTARAATGADWKPLEEIARLPKEASPPPPPEPQPQPTCLEQLGQRRGACPYCGEPVQQHATKCPHCTGDIFHCPCCNLQVAPNIQSRRTSAFSWDESFMAFCPRCKTQLAGPTPSNCFIATAAFGSPFVTEVQYLRAYRDRTLRRSRIGRTFIQVYEALSPPLACVIRKFLPLRILVCHLLRPLLWLVAHTGEIPKRQQQQRLSRSGEQRRAQTLDHT